MSSEVQSLILPPTEVNGVEINSFYYDRSDTVINSALVTNSYGRTSVSLSNSTFGSSSQVVLPKSDIINHLVLELELLPFTGTTDFKVGLVQAWGAHSIASVNYLFGGSNQEVEISGSSQLINQIVMAENREKADRIMNLMGVARVSGSTGADYVGLDNLRQYPQKAFIYLYTPFSSLRGSNTMCNKGLDTTLMSNSVHITIRFNRADHFIVYDSADPLVGQIPNGFSKAILHWRGSKFHNQANSIADNLRASPGGKYVIPFKYVRDMPSKTITNVSAQSATNLLSTVRTVELQGIENSGLLAIAFFVRQSTDSRKITENDANNAYNISPNRFAELRDVELLFNGQVVVKYSGDSHKLMNCIEKMGSSGFTYRDVTSAVGVNPNKTISNIVERFPVVLDLSQYNYAGCNDNVMSNVNRYVNSSLQLRFSIVVETYPTEITNRQYDFEGIYVYNASLGFDSSGTSQVALM